MEIHILRDGKQIGPFSEETVQSLLKQGNILINDLAWSPGLSGWNPLHAVLYPAAQPPPPPVGALPPPMPAPAVMYEAEEAGVAVLEEEPQPEPVPAPVTVEPATPRQKAFLTFMAVPFAADLSKDRAAHLVSGAMENPKNSGRLRLWEDERFRLYPDLFAEEIQARRENRSQQYLEICQGEGHEFFDGVTKAHTQVLVGYLDVRYPNWDQEERAAKYDYFFPAIAEKFPQLLKKSAKGRFKYPDGPRVAAELVQKPRAVSKGPRKSPIGAIIRGIVMGAIALGIILGVVEFQRRGGIDAVKAAIAKATAEANAAEKHAASAAAAKKPVNPAQASAPTSPTVVASTPSAAPPAPADPLVAAAPGIVAPVSTPSPSPAPADPTMAAPASPSSSSPSLFDTTPPPAAPPAPADPLAPAASQPAAAPAAPQRVFAKITRPTVITLRFGSSTLRPGTPVQVVSASGANLTIKFGPEMVAIPVANTDFAESSTPPGP